MKCLTLISVLMLSGPHEKFHITRKGVQVTAVALNVHSMTILVLRFTSISHQGRMTRALDRNRIRPESTSLFFTLRNSIRGGYTADSSAAAPAAAPLGYNIYFIGIAVCY